MLIVSALVVLFVFLALLLVQSLIGLASLFHPGRRVRLGVDWDNVRVGLEAAERCWERQRRERIKSKARSVLFDGMEETMVA